MVKDRDAEQGGGVQESDKGRRLPDECQECNLRILERARDESPAA